MCWSPSIPEIIWREEGDCREKQEQGWGELQEPEGEELLGSHHNEARLLEEGVQGVGIPAK